MAEQTIGSTRTFVLSKSFAQIGAHTALIGEDDTRRLLAEVYGDPDRSDVRPQEAYQASTFIHATRLDSETLAIVLARPGTTA